MNGNTWSTLRGGIFDPMVDPRAAEESAGCETIPNA